MQTGRLSFDCPKNTEIIIINRLIISDVSKRKRRSTLNYLLSVSNVSVNLSFHVLAGYELTVSFLSMHDKTHFIDSIG